MIYIQLFDYTSRNNIHCIIYSSIQCISMFIAHQIQISSYTPVAPLIKYSWGTIRQLDEVPLSAQLEYSSLYFERRTRARQLLNGWILFTGSKHNLNSLLPHPYYHTLTTERRVQCAIWLPVTTFFLIQY